MALALAAPSLLPFDQTTARGSTPAATGASGPVTYQWHRSALNGDLPVALGGTAQVLTGQTGLSFSDAPGRPSRSQGELWYYFATATDNVTTVRGARDVCSPLADWPRYSVVYYGTSIVANPTSVAQPGTTPDGQADPDSPPFICGRALSRINGIRWVDTLNCGQGSSYTADWLPSAGPGANLSTGQNYYTWMTGTAVPRFIAAIGKGVDLFLIMHETNDGLISPSAYQANMLTTIDALHALHPSARFALSYAPFDHLDNFAGSGTGNNAIAAKHAATDAVIAARADLCFGVGKALWRYTAAHVEEADYTTSPQPANQIHYGPQGRESIGTSWAEGIRQYLHPTSLGPTGATGIYSPSTLS